MHTDFRSHRFLIGVPRQLLATGDFRLFQARRRCLAKIYVQEGEQACTQALSS